MITKSEEAKSGITASQLGSVLGLEPVNKIRIPDRKPPFEVAAFAKQIPKMRSAIITIGNTLTWRGVGKIRRNASIARDPFRLVR